MVVYRHVFCHTRQASARVPTWHARVRRTSACATVRGRGRDAGYPTPPAQTRARAPNAHGSHLGCWRPRKHQSIRCCWSHTVQPAWLAFPAQCPVRVRLFSVLLGQRPSLHSFLRPPQVFVQPLRRYYAAARFPAAVHLSLIAHRFLPAVRGLLTTDSNGASRFSRVKFLCMLGVFDSAGSRRTRIVSHASLLPSGSPDTVGSLDWDFGAHYFGIPSLHMPLSNASDTSLPPHPHGSGSGWFATPFPV